MQQGVPTHQQISYSLYIMADSDPSTSRVSSVIADNSMLIRNQLLRPWIVLWTFHSV